jgi:hypothetical protein
MRISVDLDAPVGAVLGEKAQKIGWVVGLCGCENAGLGAIGR